MLDQIPSEIISQISYHLSLSASSSSTFEDIPPTNLLLSCRTIHEAISPSTNPRLYGKLFRALFDTDAPERRFQSASTSSTRDERQRQLLKERRRRKRRKINEEGDEDDETYGDKLKAQELTRELKKRIGCLSRLREMIEGKDVTDIVEGDLWTVYLMLIENDGKNIEHLVGPKATVNLPSFLELYHEQHFLAAAVEPGYPAETVGRSLAMWIAWLVGGSGPPDETPEQREERMFVLRPYVFAAQQYPLYFAPWVLPDLPLTKPFLPSSIELNQDNVHLNPFIADLTPKSRSVVVEHFGRSLNLCPPFLAHAAILRFFYRRLGEDGELDSDNDSIMGADTTISPFMSLQNPNHHQAQGVPVRVNDLVDGIMPGTQGIILSNPASRAPTRPTSPTPTARDGRGFLVGNSKLHDLDYQRLKSCFDPYASKGLRSTNWRNSWEGCWEGTFSFFDFDAFREMLAGHSRALYEGPYGEQAQVWRLTETYVRKEGWVRPTVEEEDEVDGEDEEEEEEEVKGLPLNGPIVNAGFPSTEQPNTYSNLASATAEAETLRQTIQQQIEAIKGYEIVPTEELEEMLELSEEEQEEAGLEMLLTGTGHSAWGKFILKGRVRNWDGMASLVKEYAPDSRGKWIYRGYVLAGDIFVGRWRDTYTPETFVGYEGTFILNRR
ncbi:hypothetical protein I302_100789 [Kwoniella bestiolae CBS 10118]|uniref:F-box domain-containing protein n=1 Tax=Kwoniella bestiolae CBS 10118 TaxID=1296100 RepID=A0A1B9G616_9TREE|nr:hypothetical protein I302_04162 [Kwoniella bestiolae CBS 10118]OCF26477.1 hypothetical protein I302_04162 [Kwoniella bestiolae CBS 10118]